MNSQQQQQQPAQNVVIDIAKQMTGPQKELPHNEQLSTVIQQTQGFLSAQGHPSTSATGTSLTPEASKALGDLQGVLGAADQLNRNKNEDEILQSLLKETVATASVAKDTGGQLRADSSLRQQGKQVGLHGNRLARAVWEVLRTMATQSQFRTLMNTLVELIQEMFLTDEQQGGELQQQQQQQPQQAQGTVETESVIKPSFAAAAAADLSSTGSSANSLAQAEQQILALKQQSGAVAEEGAGSSGEQQRKQWNLRSWRVSAPSEQKQQQIAQHFLAVLKKLNESEQFRAGLEDLIEVFQQLKQGDASTGSSSSVGSLDTSQLKEFAQNEHVDASYTQAKALVERFAGRPVDPFIEKTKVFFAFVRKDERSRDWFNGFLSLLSDSVRHPHDLEESAYVDRVKQLVRDASALTKEQDFREKYADVVIELRTLVACIGNDEDLTRLRDQTAAFLANFTYKDEQTGKTRFNFDLVSQLRTLIVPALIDQLEVIPIPPVQGSTEDMDYYFDNLVLNGKEIIPDQVNIHTQSDLSLNVQGLSASHSRSAAFIQINNIKPQVSNIHFRFTRTTFPKLSDEGVANLLVQGDQGLSVRIALDLVRQSIDQIPIQQQVATNMPLFQFQLSQVDVDIDRLKIEIVSAKHDILLKLFKSVFQSRIKTVLEQKIAEKIEQIFTRIQNGLNDLMARYTPSKVKEILTEKAGSVKSKVQGAAASLTQDQQQQQQQDLQS